MASASADGLERSGFRRTARQAFLTGVTLTIPAIVTLLVLTVVLDFLAGLLSPAVSAVNVFVPGDDLPEALVQVTVVAVVLAVTFLVGLIAEETPTHHWADRFDAAVASIPGVGSIYTSFNEMTDLLLDSDTENFRDVKLVEYPREGSYSVAFLTAETADVVEDATGHEEMVTLFMPLAPNPVMGGFVLHVPEDRVVDVDLTVEEGLRSIVTSGVTLGDHDDEELPPDPGWVEWDDAPGTDIHPADRER